MGVAAEFSPEGTSGSDLADFESAFGGVFTQSESKNESVQNRFSQESDEEEEELGGPEGDQQPQGQPQKEVIQNDSIKQVEVDALAEIENYAQDIMNRLHLGEKGLDIQEQRLLLDCITGFLEIAVKGGLTPMGKLKAAAGGQ